MTSSQLCAVICDSDEESKTDLYLKYVILWQSNWEMFSSTLQIPSGPSTANPTEGKMSFALALDLGSRMQLEAILIRMTRIQEVKRLSACQLREHLSEE